MGTCSGVVYVDCGARGTVHNGTSWTTAYTTITKALDSLSNGGDIWIKAGVYRERITIPNYTRIYGGFLGFETTIDQRLSGAFPSIIDAERKGRGISIPTGVRVTIDGIDIRNGKSDKGGGINCSTNAIVTINNCRIENCTATQSGGGIFFDTYTQGSMYNCFISRNKAALGGGAVVEYHSYPILRGSLIVHNRATSVGGGVYCPFHSGALLENCTLAYNTALESGGGLYAYYGGPVTLEYCIIAFNSAPEGGGIYGGGGSSQATITNCDWYSNPGGDCGGAILSLPAASGNLFTDPKFIMPEANEYHLYKDSPCGGIGAFPVDDTYSVERIGVAKRFSDGELVKLSNKVVSCMDGDIAYLEENDRSTAIAVKGLAGCSVGTILSNVTGTLSTIQNRKVLIASSFDIVPNASYIPRPLGARMSWLESLIGVRVTTLGTVSAITQDGFELTDGLETVPIRSTATASPGSMIIIDGVYTADGYFIADGIRNP